MTSKPSITNFSRAQVGQALSSAQASGLLSQQLSAQLSGNLGDVVIAGASGVDADSIMATDVTLVTILLDASSSIGYGKLEQAVRDGHNELLESFAGSREKDSVLVALWTFADDAEVVHAYLPIGDATRLDQKNYRAGGCTRLYDTWCDALTANLAYAERLRDNGTPVRSIVVVITDGMDNRSSKKQYECKQLSDSLLKSEQFILAFVGVGADDFQGVAKRMGIPSGCIEVQTSVTPSGLRQVFQMVSRSAIRASQGLISPGAQAGFFRP